MKTQNYSNFILTIIAFFLMAIFFHQVGLIPQAYAAPDHSELDVNIKSIGGYSLYGGKLQVEVDNTVDVRCENCD